MKFVHCFPVLLVANPHKRIKLGAKTMRRMCKLRQRPMAGAGLGATYIVCIVEACGTSGATAVAAAAAAAARGLLKALLTLRLRPEIGQDLGTDSDTERGGRGTVQEQGREEGSRIHMSASSSMCALNGKRKRIWLLDNDSVYS